MNRPKNWSGCVINAASTMVVASAQGDSSGESVDALSRSGYRRGLSGMGSSRPNQDF
jgi:hypothetical protein